MTTMPTHTYALARHMLRLNDWVTVELLVVGAPTQVGPRIVVGRIADATESVLLLEHEDGTAIRIPWAAVALIRDTHTPHPAL